MTSQDAFVHGCVSVVGDGAVSGTDGVLSGAFAEAARMLMDAGQVDGMVRVLLWEVCVRLQRQGSGSLKKKRTQKVMMTQKMMTIPHGETAGSMESAS
jgi:hypothetical protein